MGIFAELFDRAKVNPAEAAKNPPRAQMARITVPTPPRPAAARVLVQGVPHRPAAEQSDRRPAAEQARYDREQAVNTARVIAETKAIASYYARGEARLAQQAADAERKADREFAQSVLRAAAKFRGEKFSTKDWVEPPPQATYSPTAAEIIAAAEKRRSL